MSEVLLTIVTNDLPPSDGDATCPAAVSHAYSPHRTAYLAQKPAASARDAGDSIVGAAAVRATDVANRSTFAIEHYYRELKKKRLRDEHDSISISSSQRNRISNHTGDDEGKEKKGRKRPYTEYNLFFKLERELLLRDAEASSSSSSQSQQPMNSTPSSTLAGSNTGGDPLPWPLPQRYRGLKLPPNWYMPDSQPRRKHCKTDSVIGFHELSRTISQRWKALDDGDESKKFCREVAAHASAPYKHEQMQIKQEKKQLKQARIVAAARELHARRLEEEQRKHEMKQQQKQADDILNAKIDAAAAEEEEGDNERYHRLGVMSS